MKADIKQRWVTALRSGHYKQGHNVLHDPATNKYCCLGVLCHLAEQDEVVASRPYPYAPGAAVQYYAPSSPDRGAHQFLPAEVSVWAGFPDVVGDPEVERDSDEGGTYMETLSGLNDGGYTFAEIASIIEREF